MLWATSVFFALTAAVCGYGLAMYLTSGTNADILRACIAAGGIVLCSLVSLILAIAAAMLSIGRRLHALRNRTVAAEDDIVFP